MSTFNVNALSMSMKARTYAAIRNIDLLIIAEFLLGARVGRFPTLFYERLGSRVPSR
jgi:hypothetical protein